MWEKRYCRNEIKIPEIRPFCAVICNSRRNPREGTIAAERESDGDHLEVRNDNLNAYT